MSNITFNKEQVMYAIMEAYIKGEKQGGRWKGSADKAAVACEEVYQNLLIKKLTEA